MKRVRKVAARPRDDRDDEKDSRDAGGGRDEWEGEFNGDDAEIYRYVTVPSVGDEVSTAGAPDPVRQQVSELFSDFQHHVGESEETFRQFMLWAAETDGVVFEDLLIATRSVYDMMGVQMPCGKQTWDEMVELANLVEVSKVSDSELEYALEVFSKTYDLYRSELKRLQKHKPCS